jgi:hypothetical protein
MKAGQLSRIVRALELLEDGRDYTTRAVCADAADEAVALLSEVEDELAGPSQSGNAFPCECGAELPWPGLLAKHRILSGHEPTNLEQAA